MSDARDAAFAVTRRVFDEGAYADRALHSQASGLDGRDRALAMALAYGVVQRRATLDHVIEQLTDRPVTKLQPAALAALRLGLVQLLYMDGVPDHAAVSESVELAKRHANPGAARLVNAVLRRAVAEGPAILAALTDDTAEHAALRHSVPEWLSRQLFTELGPEQSRALLAAVNQPAESALRVNTLRATVPDVIAALPVPAHPAAELPEGLVLEGAFDAHGSALFAGGAIMPQSRASMLVARMLDPQPGERVLDLCAAPGAKTTHLAALMGDRGEVVAVERHAGRAGALRDTCRRLSAGCVRVEVADATMFDAQDAFDRVLIDPPCSGLGTLQSRPDLRWRTSAEAVTELAALQRVILAAGAAATRPGGTLVYSVCTISRAESQEVIDTLGPDFELETQRQLLPHVDGTDGFFMARLRRRSD